MLSGLEATVTVSFPQVTCEALSEILSNNALAVSLRYLMGVWFRKGGKGAC